jgi:hypothetical protein
MGPHEEFLELCALSTSGELTEEEGRKLAAHLAECAECREALQQFETVVDRALPAAAPELEPQTTESEPPSGALAGEKALLDRLTQRRKQGSDSLGDPLAPLVREDKKLRRRPRLHTIEFWLPFAAGLLLVVALGIVLFRGGSGRLVATQAERGTATPATEIPIRKSPESEERDRVIAQLRHQMELQSAETAQLRAELKGLETKAQSSESEQSRVAQERDALTEKLHVQEAALAKLQQDVETRELVTSRSDAEIAALEEKIADLSYLAEERAKTVDKQAVLLERDRDIRELMGARDLYVAEVYDVGRTGETQKPCGRVFLTKGKSLIFYAFDLDQQPGLKDGNSFQAWGRRGPDKAQALNLGIFYEDNLAKKRWIVKSEDPKTLAQIDAVFVTVEPKGGSAKPSGKQLLFAYLKADSNHP